MAGPATNAEVLARLDVILTAVNDLKAQVFEMEDKRQAFRQEYDQHSGETAKMLAVLEHRVTAAEKRDEVRALEISTLVKTAEAQGRSIERLKTIMNIMVGVLSSVGTFMLLWVVGQWLNLI